MEWLGNLFFGTGTAHSIFVLALTISCGIMMGQVKIKGISLGITWILFMGLIFSHFGMTLDKATGDFIKEFGLILFIYAVGLQVGPGFFSSFRHGGVRMNLLAVSIVVLGCVTCYVIHLVTGEELSTMVGIMSGAVTNTPGLGAAQQTFADMAGRANDNIALGYAVAYPLGVIGVILSMILIRKVFRVDADRESTSEADEKHAQAERINVEVHNAGIEGHTVSEIGKFLNYGFVVSRIRHADETVDIATESSVVMAGDVLRIIVKPEDRDAVIACLGKEVHIDPPVWEKDNPLLVSRRILVTKPELNGTPIGKLNIRSLYGVNITRVNRAGIDLVATYSLRLQMGDRVTVVGAESSIQKVANLLGNSLKRLDMPNLFAIFIGIFLGVFLGMIPFMVPGIPQPIKLGLAGGPLIVAILLSRYGPNYRIVSFTTISASMMLREVGISMFLAAVGLGAGSGFVDAITGGGYWWVLYGFIITMVPVLLVGCYARWRYKTNYYVLLGLLSGSTTNPPAMAYANSVAQDDRISVAYATVYPLTMFLRILLAQIMILIAIG